MNEVAELLLIDKPAGITSMDVIRKLRRKLNIRKIGHAGTLDPLATGLMLVGVGPGTKKLTDLIKLDKEYLAEVRIGESRTTGDLEGNIVEEKNASTVTEKDVKCILKKMLGTLTLPVSVYSAVKKGGIPMYKLAREAEKTGEVVNGVPLREMEIKEAELIDFESGELAVAKVRFFVGSGTYIRSLGEELGRRLSYPATIQNLKRTKVGKYLLQDSEQL